MLRKNFINYIDKCRRYKRFLVPFGEVFISVLILLLSYWIGLGVIDTKYKPQILFLIPILVTAKILLFWAFRLYHISYAAASTN